uniref:Putative calcium-binding protein CML30 n=1 Tax=Aegilops tauschii TaxID=37682 RepID=M8C498_AEGTA
MAPLLLLFLLGGLCALFSLASSSSRGAKKCCDAGGEKAKSHHGEQEAKASKAVEEREARPAPADREADLGIVFSTFDHDGDGFITAGELEELYGPTPKKRKASLLPASAGAADGAEEEEDEEGEEMDLKEAFDVFDGNKDGLISAEELGTVLGSLGLRGRPAAAECRDMIRLVDADGDGMVNFEEFKRMMAVVKA